MGMRIDHVALAVTDLDVAIAHYEKAWGLTVDNRERVSDDGVEEVMLAVGDSHLQLLGATGPDTIVADFLAKRGEGLHHIAYEVDDLESTLEHLRSLGVELIDEKPRRGGRNRMVAFVHPRSNHGLLVELTQRPR